MNIKEWNTSHAKKLLDCFLEIEENQYPEFHKVKAKIRSETVRKFIVEFGADHVTVNNYTNMMQLSSSITIDVYQTGGSLKGNIEIDLGSETHELYAKRNTWDSKKLKHIDQVFNFELWVWEELKVIIPEPED